MMRGSENIDIIISEVVRGYNQALAAVSEPTFTETLAQCHSQWLGRELAACVLS
jgi:hypothetical protein